MAVHVRGPGETGGPDGYRDGFALNFLCYFLCFKTKKVSEDCIKTKRTVRFKYLVCFFFL
jgi:hypothetical protein